MIGSHDTFTYLQPANPIFRLFTGLWRTQCKTIGEQYDAGVRFFDIRVVRHKGYWYFAHGIVRLKGRKFKLINNICKFMKRLYPEAIYRIVLERGNMTDEIEFLNETYVMCSMYHHLWRLDIKNDKVWMGKYGNNNERLYNAGYRFANVNTWTCPSYEITGHITKNNWYRTSLRTQAVKMHVSNDWLSAGFYSKESQKKMAESKDWLYLIDYCTNEFK